MKIISILIIILLLSAGCFAQEEMQLIDQFRIKIQENTLTVLPSAEDRILFQKSFSNPTSITQDMDNDGTKELLVTDCLQNRGVCSYTVYLFNAVDSFYMVDSIFSGLKNPYSFSSEEINEEILVTGSPDFDSLYSGSLGSSFSPIICWQYNGTELEIVNDKLYDIFISENEATIEFIDVYLKENGKNCASLNKLKQAIAAVYANYITADERTNAEYTLKRYYSCDDLDKFKALLNSLL